MIKKAVRILFMFGIISCQAVTAFSQVTIVPTNLFIDNHTHFASLQIKNTSSQTQEVSIKFKFGFPVTDSLGNIRMDYHDSIAAAKYSMAQWIHAFPRSFTLRPNGSQLVRLLIRTPENLPDRMYWTRIQTISAPQTPLIGKKSRNSVSAQISFKFNQVTSAYLKIGRPSTGINIQSFRYKEDGDQLFTYIKAKRLGNAPFLGSIYVRLYKKGQKNPVAGTYMLTSLFFDQTSRITLNNINKLTPGNYIAKISFISRRGDIDPKELVHMQAVSKKFNVTLQ